MNVAVQKAVQHKGLAPQSCERGCDRAWDQACDMDQLRDSPDASSRRRILCLGLVVSLIAHIGALAALTAIGRPMVIRPSQNSELIYLLYTASPRSQGSPAGASGTVPVAAARPEAKPRRVARPRRKLKPPPETVAAAPRANAIPPRTAMLTRTDVVPVSKSSLVSGQGRDNAGAAARGGIAAGTGAAPGADTGAVFGADQVEHPPVLLSRVMPPYPAQARARGIDGEVVLRAIVARDGHVERDIVIAQSSPLFDQTAIDALRQWRFEPGRDRDGRPVRVMLEVPIRFQLR